MCSDESENVQGVITRQLETFIVSPIRRALRLTGRYKETQSRFVKATLAWYILKDETDYRRNNRG